MTIANPEKAFSVACGCGAAVGEECPHTPIRCPHEWHYGKMGEGLSGDASDSEKIGAQRACEYCGRTEKGVLSWKTLIA